MLNIIGKHKNIREIGERGKCSFPRYLLRVFYVLILDNVIDE